MSILFGPGESPFQNARGKKKQNKNSLNTTSTSKHEDLLVFGYECKFFRDDLVAQDVNSGKKLIPWMGNKDLMIDRYDCRGHLYRLEDFDFSNSAKTEMSTSEIDIESILDEERYLDLNKEDTTIEDEILKEEAEKRSKALYDPYTAYQSINYSYEESSSNGKSLSDLDSKTDSTFKQYCQYYGYDEKDQAVKTYFEAYQKQQQYEYNRPPPPPNPPSGLNPMAQEAMATSKVTEEKEPEPFQPPEGIDIPSTVELKILPNVAAPSL